MHRYARKHALIVAVDFDQTIYDNNTETVYDDCADVLRALKDELGAEIIIHTCRARAGVEVVDGVRWCHSAPFAVQICKEHGIPFDDITAYKPMADVYIDDKAVHFDGSWADIAQPLFLLARNHPTNLEAQPVADTVPASIDEALTTIRNIFASKNADYANTTWSSNFQDVATQMGWSSAQDAAEALIAVKQARLRSLRVNGSIPKNESTWDTKLDRAVYSVIVMALDIEGN